MEKKKVGLEDGDVSTFYHFFFCVLTFDNSLILHIYIIIRKYYHTYFELIHSFYS